jgi:adenylate cyclase class IV
MAMEIEAKIKISGPRRLTLMQAVRDLGGKDKFIRTETNVFYDTPRRKLDGKDEVLRLRNESYTFDSSVNYDCNCDCHNQRDVVSMTFKGKRAKGPMKVRPEHEFNVSDFEQARLLLGALGYKEYFRFEKKRHSFQLENAVVEFDTLPYIGEFVEIEGVSESKVNKVIKKLGLEDEPLIKEGYGGLLWADAKKNKRSKKVAVFG